MGSNSPGPSPLLVAALSAAFGAALGLFAGYLVRDKTRPTSTTFKPTVPEEAGPSGAETMVSADQAQRLDDLEGRLSALSAEVELLKGSARVPVVTEEPAELHTDEEFTERYESVVIGIIDRDRFERKISQVTDALCAVIELGGQRDPDVNQHADFLKSTAEEYMKRQKAIIQDLTPSGDWPEQDDPKYAEWTQRWIELRGWLTGELRQVLSVDKAASLQDRIEQASYVTEW